MSKHYGLGQDLAQRLTQDPKVADYFEDVVAEQERLRKLRADQEDRELSYALCVGIEPENV